MILKELQNKIFNSIRFGIVQLYSSAFQTETIFA